MKRIVTVIVMAVVVGFSSVANAGDLNLGPKSPNTATTLSTMGTLVPAALGISLAGREGGFEGGAVLFVVSATFGPALGHSYAGNGKRAATGILIRTSCWFAGLAVAGAVAPGSSDPMGVGIGTLLVAGGLVSVSAFYDMATAAGSARKYNRKHGLGGLSVAPTYDLSKKQAGVRLSVQF